MSHMFKCSLVTIIYSHDSCTTTCSCMTIMAFILGVGVDLVNSYIYTHVCLVVEDSLHKGYVWMLGKWKIWPKEGKYRWKVEEKIKYIFKVNKLFFSYLSNFKIYKFYIILIIFDFLVFFIR